ncbi:FAM45 family protein [Planoprotostelium fungivorum]|uniref:FAM45 family protein n=1 Tax=Planoprotostelium fungivorum TaxID=1890364 RepID=A0A2P6MR05_9EUKA|nr:FAM45 family protein [Planoprotostelium fungivorum]
MKQERSLTLESFVREVRFSPRAQPHSGNDDHNREIVLNCGTTRRTRQKPVTMDSLRSLSSVLLIEKDIYADVLPVWSFPQISTEVQDVVVSRSGLQHETIPLQFTFSRFGNQWIYSFIDIRKEDSGLTDKVQAAQATVVTTDFNPERYNELTKMMVHIYLSTGSPLKVAECYVSVFAKGSYNAGDSFGEFSAASHDARAAYLASSIKDVIRIFGEDIILIWAALIMKKRLIVVSQKLGLLQKICRALPVLVWHRQNWDIVRPYVNHSDNEISDVQDSQVYIAGFIDESIREREDLYDLLVDVNNRSVTVSSAAKGDFMMTGVHRGICEFLVTTAENAESTDADIIRGNSTKIKDLLNKLEQLKVERDNGEPIVDYKALQEAGLPPNLDKFLYQLATAEGMTALTA